jgi:DNA repair protein RadC
MLYTSSTTRDSALAECGREQPRERLYRLGVTALSDEELVAIVLRTGSAGNSALDIGRELVSGGLNNLILSPPEKLCLTPGLGQAKAATLLAGIELGRRTLLAGGPVVTTPEEAFQLVQDMGVLKKEVFRALYLDGRRRLIHSETVSIGTLTSTLVHPREVFQPAIACSAASLLVAHNHPSGDPGPSPEDFALTRRLRDAGRLLGIELVDHLVVGRGRFVSLKQLGDF